MNFCQYEILCCGIQYDNYCPDNVVFAPEKAEKGCKELRLRKQKTFRRTRKQNAVNNFSCRNQQTHLVKVLQVGSFRALKGVLRTSIFQRLWTTCATLIFKKTRLEQIFRSPLPGKCTVLFFHDAGGESGVLCLCISHYEFISSSWWFDAHRMKIFSVIGLQRRLLPVITAKRHAN